MNQINLCPECKTSISAKAQVCSCGWRYQNLKGAALVDNRCRFSVMGRRCPAIGTMSTSTRTNDQWYCLAHFVTRNDPIRAKLELERAEKKCNGDLERQVSWRQLLLEKISSKSQSRESLV